MPTTPAPAISINNIAKQLEVEQVNMLIYCMGDRADDIFVSLKFTEDQKAKYKEVVSAFDNNFNQTDRIVVGIEDKKLSERMQLLNDPTLEKAITMAKQSEQVKNQQPQIRRGNLQIAGNSEKRTTAGTPESFSGWTPGSGQVYNKCGGDNKKHPENKYPAATAICNTCKRKGHYGKVCSSVKCNVNEITEQEDAFVGTIKAISNQKINPKRKWNAMIE
ncbi:hypothetical protein ILUMI_00802, partial [Ignelater luminosus]